jgi:hypothetical protein
MVAAALASMVMLHRTVANAFVGPSTRAGRLSRASRAADYDDGAYEPPVLGKPVGRDERSDFEKRWDVMKKPVVNQIQPDEVADLEDDGELPWDRETAELMIDATSVAKYVLDKFEDENSHIKLNGDVYSWWPSRVLAAVRRLVPIYGKDRPPSPWNPIIVVFDRPDPLRYHNAFKIKQYRNLARQGPDNMVKGMTTAVSGTYVEEVRKGNEWNGRADEEMLYMLELLVREWPMRRQVLVSADKDLREMARRHCMVRSPEWLLRELQRLGEEGVAAMNFLDPMQHAEIVEKDLAPNGNVGGFTNGGLRSSLVGAIFY